MATFTLGHYRITFDIEPLRGECATAERHLAWQLCLQLGCRPGLRQPTLAAAEVHGLIDELRCLLALWPAQHLPGAAPLQLAVVLLEVIEVVLMPCLAFDPVPPPLARAVQDFCLQLSAQLSQTYRLPACQVETQIDLRAACDAGSATPTP